MISTSNGKIGRGQEHVNGSHNSGWDGGRDGRASSGQCRTYGRLWPGAGACGVPYGCWRVARGPFAGTATFGPLDEGGLPHHESGTFTRQGVSHPGERTLRYLPGNSAVSAKVRFADGRPFHDLDLTAGRRVAHLPCAAVLYRGEFTVHDGDLCRTGWRAVGAKDLVLTTDYVRGG